jgi:hypothetical protein
MRSLADEISVAVRWYLDEVERAAERGDDPRLAACKHFANARRETGPHRPSRA